MVAVRRKDGGIQRSKQIAEKQTEQILHRSMNNKVNGRNLKCSKVKEQGRE